MGRLSVFACLHGRQGYETRPVKLYCGAVFHRATAVDNKLVKKKPGAIQYMGEFPGGKFSLWFQVFGFRFFSIVRLE